VRLRDRLSDELNAAAVAWARSQHPLDSDRLHRVRRSAIFWTVGSLILLVIDVFVFHGWARIVEPVVVAANYGF
jgi:hypothetical protein